MKTQPFLPSDGTPQEGFQTLPPIQQASELLRVMAGCSLCQKPQGKKLVVKLPPYLTFFSLSEPNFKNFNSCILHLNTSYSTLLLKFLYSHFPHTHPPTPTKSPGFLFISYLSLICPCQSPHQHKHSDSPLLEHLQQSIIITFPQLHQ